MEKYRDIKVQKFSTSTKKQHFLLSYENSQYEATAAVVALLLILQSNSSIDESIREYCKLTKFHLSNANIIPVRSDKPEDFVNYRNSIVAFYETEDYNPYVDFALNTQIKRINEISPAKFQFDGDSTGLTR